MERLLKVLVIDDSALVRQTLASIINADPHLEVIGVAADPYFAAEKIKRCVPDVITLDIEMPRMDGITFLKTLMSRHPVPVVVISSLTKAGSDLALKALDLGAAEVIAKSEIRNTREYLQETRIRITDAIKSAYLAPVKKKITNEKSFGNTLPPDRSFFNADYNTTDRVIAIGASTGGTEALRHILKNLRGNVPGIVVTQHMPAGFTRSFAKHLNDICEIRVKEAQDGERIMRGHAYIAPGGRHMEVYRSGAKYFIRVRDGELVNRHRPSVDVLFNSVAHHVGKNSLGLILTGMGRDGATGLLSMRSAGAQTVAQDEESSVIFGMPREAIKLEAAGEVLALKEMPHCIMAYAKSSLAG